MLRDLLRSAGRRVAVAGVSAAAVVALAVPASATVLGPGGNDQDRPLDPIPDQITDQLDGPCRSAMRVPARLLPESIDISACDLRGKLVHAGSLTVRVPRAAETGATAASTVTDNAPPSTVTELTARNTGREILVDVVHLAEQIADGAAGELPKLGRSPLQSTARACTATAYAYAGIRNDGMRWHFNRASTPAYLNPHLAVADIVGGARRLVHGTNDCALGRLTGLHQKYAGTTSRRANCHGPDGHSTVGFGDRPAETLGTACWWYSVDGGEQRVFETDIRFQDNPGMFYTIERLGCADRYALTGVATHEFGHAFGLAHVSEARFPHQTMSPIAPKCSYASSTLGRGDWLGLHRRYSG